MHFNTQLLKRKLDGDDQVEHDVRTKRHNHLHSPPFSDLHSTSTFAIPNPQAFSLSSVSSSSSTTPLSTSALDSDSMLIDEIPLFMNPSPIDSFNANPNQFHHNRGEVLPPFMTGRNAATAGVVRGGTVTGTREKIIRVGGFGGHMV